MSYNYSTTLSYDGLDAFVEYYTEEHPISQKNDLTVRCNSTYTITITGTTISCSTSVWRYRDYSYFFLTINNDKEPYEYTDYIVGKNNNPPPNLPTISPTVSTTRVPTAYSLYNGDNTSTPYGNFMLLATSRVFLDIKTYICSPGFTFVNTTLPPPIYTLNKYSLFNNKYLYQSVTEIYVGINFVFLPVPSGNNGKIFFIKDKNNNAANSNIVIIPPTSVTIDGQNTCTISVNSGCLTLMCDGTKYLIVNAYPSINQGLVPTAINLNSFFGRPINTFGTAIINKINVFNVNDHSIRSNLSYNNSVDLQPLPQGSSPAMCIIVYAGDANNAASRDEHHPLYITYYGLDNRDNYSYIYTNGNKTSSGIVLITDGNRWYIAGWMWGNQWEWDSNNTAGNYKDIPLHNGFLNVTNADATVRNQILYAASTSCLKIIKVTRNSNTIKQHYSVKDASDASITNVYLNTSNSQSPSNYSMYYKTNNTNSCVWFACHVSGGNTYYYPVIGYTPN